MRGIRRDIMNYSVNKEKMEQAVDYLRKYDINAWLILTSEGSDPCLPLVTGVKTVGPGAFLITDKGEKYAVCSSIDAQDIEQSGLFDSVIKYSDGLSKPLKELILSIDHKKLALNFSIHENLCDGLTLGRFRWLQDILDKDFQGEFVSSEVFLKKIRSIKTPEEIKLIKKAVDITIDIYDSIFKQLRVGLSEKQVGSIFVDEMIKRGVVNGIDKSLSMPIVMKENIAHRGPSDAAIDYGDMLIMDFSVDYEGYVSDIARTVYFLKPEEYEAPIEMQRAFEAAYGAISAAREALKPGALGYEVDTVAREYLLSRGMPEITHATGHQIGRECHDGGTLLGPKWDRYGNAPYERVEENMVFTLEPTILPDKKPFILVEENLVVTNSGAEYLSRRQEELVLIRS